MTSLQVARTPVPTGTCVLDHIAVRVLDRDAVADELLEVLDIRVLERNERLTLLGPTFEHGKITLLDAPVGEDFAPSRVISLMLAAGAGRAVDAPIVLACGLVLTFQGSEVHDTRAIQAPRHSLVGVALRSDDPPIAATLLGAEYGLYVASVNADSATLTCGLDEHAITGGVVTLLRDRSLHDEPGLLAYPILDHIGIRVDDAAQWRAYAQSAGLELEKWVEAEHSRAAFVTAPDALVLEYVEQTAPLGDD